MTAKSKNAPALGPEPRKLDEQTIEVVANAIRAGANVQDAAHHAGVSKASLMDWLAYGRAARVEGITTIYSALLDRVERARADCKLESIAIIRAAARDRVENGVKKPGQWAAAAWWLERRYPDEYGQRFRALIGIEPERATTAVEALLREVFTDERLKLNKRQQAILPRILQDALATLEAEQSQDDATPTPAPMLATTGKR